MESPTVHNMGTYIEDFGNIINDVPLFFAIFDLPIEIFLWILSNNVKFFVIFLSLAST